MTLKLGRINRRTETQKYNTPMKKYNVILTTLLLAIITSLSAQAQDIRVKGGKVLIDKTPVALLEGKIGFFKDADLTICSLNGNPLVTFKAGRFKYFLPKFTDWLYYDISFVKTGRTARFKYTERLTAEKKVAEMLFTASDRPLINNNEIDTVAEAAFFKKYDNSEQFRADTTEKSGYERRLIRVLLLANPPRDLKQPVVLKKNDDEIDVFQGGVHIACVEARFKGQPNTPEAKVDYYIYKALAEPFDNGTVKTTWGLAAYANCFNSSSSIGIVQTRKYIALTDISVSTPNALKLIVELLVKNGYL